VQETTGDGIHTQLVNRSGRRTKSGKVMRREAGSGPRGRQRATPEDAPSSTGTEILHMPDEPSGRVVSA